MRVLINIVRIKEEDVSVRGVEYLVVQLVEALHCISEVRFLMVSLEFFNDFILQPYPDPGSSLL